MVSAWGPTGQTVTRLFIASLERPMKGSGKLVGFGSLLSWHVNGQRSAKKSSKAVRKSSKLAMKSSAADDKSTGSAKRRRPKENKPSSSVSPVWQGRLRSKSCEDTLPKPAPKINEDVLYLDYQYLSIFYVYASVQPACEYNLKPGNILAQNNMQLEYVCLIR